MRRPQKLKLKYFLEKMTLCDVWKVCSHVFLWRWRSKDSVFLKFDSVNIGMMLLLYIEIRKVWSVNCLLYWKTKWRINTSHLPGLIYNRSIMPMFTPFKLQENWIFRSPPSKKYIGKQFHTSQGVIFSKKVFKLQVLWSSHQFIKQGWRRN